MKDEIDRSISQLEYKDYAKPFYISYTIEDTRTLYVNASLGSIVNSNEKKYRSWGNRVLCGTYELNDENFMDATRNPAPSDGRLQLPIDDDYWGIRRALWIITNNTYKSAAENYRSKLEALKDKNLTKDTLEIPDFAKSPTVNLIIEPKNKEWNKQLLEDKVKTISSTFLKYPDIVFSDVSIYQINANLYFYSSENSKIKQPVQFTILTVTAVCEAGNGEKFSNQLQYVVNLPSQLPSNDTIISHCNALAIFLGQLQDVPVSKENYSGPVMYTGQATPEILTQCMFYGNDNLFAYREPLYNNSQMSMYYGQNMNSFETKLGKLVASKNISITEFTKKDNYHGIPLIGNYQCDAEGVIPKDTMVLIDKGILKTLYNGRTPTRNIPLSNGHRRYVLVNGGISNNLGPGVVEISSSEKKSVTELKTMLINEAKNEGLDYAILIKPIVETNGYTPLAAFKVDVNNGSEKPIRGLSMKPLNINYLKKIIGFSDKNIVYNNISEGGMSPIDGSNSGKQVIPSGNPTSIICPSAIVVKEIDFEYISKALVNDKIIVPSPLKK